MNHYKNFQYLHPRALSGARLSLSALALVALGTGCFRATGYSRPTELATEIPASGGDRVHGPKADAGPGDFYMGNDYVELAVDGAVYGDREAIAGAPSGGSIVDIGVVALDANYQRTSPPVDWVERLTPVVNQDPDISVVIDQITTNNLGDSAVLKMKGGIVDPLHKLSGATWDARGRVQGVMVLHQISLGKMDSFFRLETTLTNTSGSSLGIRSLGDFLLQKGGGYRVNVPAAEDAQGTPLSTWGVQIPGTSFAQPLAGSVAAPMISFMGVESGGASSDCHGSFGILPENQDHLLVASDPQSAMTDFRPRFPNRVVAGSPAEATDLAAGKSLTYARRLYSIGGSTQTHGWQAGVGSMGLPNQATGLQNLMTRDRVTLRGGGMGVTYLSTFGSAERMGALPAEIRFERNEGTDAAPVWKLERVEWWEPYEMAPGLSRSANPILGVALRPGHYRLVVRNMEPLSMVEDTFRNLMDAERPDIPQPLIVKNLESFQISTREVIAPERDALLGSSGSVSTKPYSSFYFYSRPIGAPDDSLQPGRFTLLGVEGTADPVMRRQTTFCGYFEPLLKGKGLTTYNIASYAFLGGNMGFGASNVANSALTFQLKDGAYQVIHSRGPLSPLEQYQIQAYAGQELTYHRFIQTNGARPSGWTSFDLPGPGLTSTGGYHNAEKLSSALAEDIQVLGMAEEDRLVDAQSLRHDYRVEIEFVGITNDQRAVIGDDPFLVPGRVTKLDGFGTVSALFTEAPRNERYAGARRTAGWTLADFQAQGQGQYTIVHRPRGPQGLFTLKGFDPTKKLSEAPNQWWNATGILSLGKTQGGFDALELIRAEFSDANGEALDLREAANATAWFQEFKTLRADWFALLNQQTPTAFTKALGLSGARFSQDTLVGAARTYLQASGFSQTDFSAVLKALRSGAAVASTGPMVEFTVNGKGPGSLVSGSGSTLSLAFTVTAAPWVPVEELRVVVNGQVVQTIDPASLTLTQGNQFVYTGTLSLSLPAGVQDAWVVLEGGAPLATTGAYRPGSEWSVLTRGLYPLFVTNPVFVDAAGDGYLPPVR